MEEEGPQEEEGGLREVGEEGEEHWRAVEEREVEGHLVEGVELPLRELLPLTLAPQLQTHEEWYATSNPQSWKFSLPSASVALSLSWYCLISASSDATFSSNTARMRPLCAEATDPQQNIQ